MIGASIELKSGFPCDACQQTNQDCAHFVSPVLRHVRVCRRCLNQAMTELRHARSENEAANVEPATPESEGQDQHVFAPGDRVRLLWDGRQNLPAHIHRSWATVLRVKRGGRLVVVSDAEIGVERTIYASQISQYTATADSLGQAREEA